MTSRINIGPWAIPFGKIYFVYVTFPRVVSYTRLSFIAYCIPYSTYTDYLDSHHHHAYLMLSPDL